MPGGKRRNARGGRAHDDPARAAGRGARIPGLTELARLYGIQPTYVDASEQRRAATPEGLLALLHALGAPVGGPGDVRDALKQRRDSDWRTPTDPVHLAWDGRPLPMELRLPADRADSRAECTLTLEQGDARVWATRLADLDVAAEHGEGAQRFVAKRLPLPSPLPAGYHQLLIEGIGTPAETLLISAPKRAYGPDAREWGVFLPLYSLRSRRSLGIGDLTDMAALARWVGELGGSAMATLPLFAAFLDEPFEPSPYAPASRLFWNELYLDLEAAPGLENAPGAREILQSRAFRRAARKEVLADIVDYRRVADLKGRVLAELAAAFDTDDARFQSFLARRPRLPRYAAFRAATRRYAKPWSQWPAAARDGRFAEGDLDPADLRYHMYAQFAMDEQLAALAQMGRRGEAPGERSAAPGERRGDRALDAEREIAGGRDGATAGGGHPASGKTAGARPGPSRHPALPPSDAPAAGLYLDIPLGVSRDGYDVWANRALFPDGVSAGAPPDALFSGGQDWGFPPMHPEELRRTGYRYFVDSLRTVMPFAGTLRFDHVMSLHRLYWIPRGFGARDGTYVRYRPEEFYAILSLESHRHRTRIVGEDLGTVPQEVRAHMGRHHIARMYVMQYEGNPKAKPPVRAVTPGSVASLNTHDMPTFAGFWTGADIEDRRELGLTDQRHLKGEHRDREKLRRAMASFLTDEGWLEGPADRPDVLRAALEFLSSGDAWLTLASLEDLWGETRPQNMPGTAEERPNWRRRAGPSLEQMQDDPAVAGILRTIDRIRRESRTDHG